MISITPSHIIEYLFCPRFIYFQNVLCIPQHEEKSYKAMKGRNIHNEKTKINKSYLRKKLVVEEKYSEVYLASQNLRGKVDEVLLLSDKTMAPLDYKFAKYKDIVYSTYKTQLFCYAHLIQENYQAEVKKGYLVYTRSKNRIVDVDVNPGDIDTIKQKIEKIIEIIDKNTFPKATKYKKRCISCTYRNICMK